MEGFKTVTDITYGEYEEKHSKFIAEVRHAESEEEVSEIIAEVRKKNPGSRHVVSAYRLSGGYEHFSDDGEPSGTGGKPVLELLRRRELTDTVITVTRYFGGVLLGVGGLKRAYTEAAVNALASAPVAVKSKAVLFSFSVGYAYFEKISQTLECYGGEIKGKEFSDGVSVTAAVPAESADKFSGFLSEYTAGSGRINEKKEILYKFQKKKSVL